MLGISALRRLQLGLIVLAIAAGFYRFPAPQIEQTYSNGAYPALDRAVRSLTGPIPFAVGDGLLIAALALLVVWWIGLLRSRNLPDLIGRVGRALVATLALLAFAFLWFLGSWGLNYERIPVEQKLVLHRERTGPEAVTALANKAATMLEANVGAAHAEMDALARGSVAQSPTELARRLQPSWDAVVSRLGDRTVPGPVPIKPTIFAWFMRASGAHGFTDPWTHEINLDRGLFAYE
ncbi:MAG: DUF3810 family protein, partial [Vulcanimicrobiaceae bacterium]